MQTELLQICQIIITNNESSKERISLNIASKLHLSHLLIPI